MPKLAANLSLMFPELDFLDRFAAAANAGFKGVEMLFPYAYPAEVIQAQLEAHGLELVLFNMPPGDWDAGERGLACVPGREDAFKAGVEQALAYARTLGCKRVHCMAGLTPEGYSPQEVRALYLNNLRLATQHFEPDGIHVLIEPINTRDMPGYYLTYSLQALDILDELGAGNAALQFDLYHAQIMQGDLSQTLSRHIDRIAHGQIADTPGRHEPGTGEINYPFLLDHLDGLDYRGWVGCEYRPRAGTLDGLSWATPYLTSSQGR